MDLETFLNLPTEEVARIVRAAGPKVCVFPINGTRRWLMLEHPEAVAENFVKAYLDIAGRRHVEVYRLFFDHGIDTLLTPVFGPDILERGEGYNELVRDGLSWFARGQDFLDFYEAYDVRVRVYGDYRRYFEGTPYAGFIRDFQAVEQRTASHSHYRLFFGVCAHDAAETVAAIGAQFYQAHGRLPNKREIVEAYYGEYVAPVDFFIGFDKFTVFDMPLVSTGNEDLYFTVAPSLYLDARQLCSILFDHLYARPKEESSYLEMTEADWAAMRDFYRANAENILGIGTTYKGVWYPKSQVQSWPTG
ncbi:MAG TPA: diterpene synthase [Anaerolineae bacterium]|mgnify:CR=1 FL=1|nr:diterpene synthase [Anaerolineae bacterium]HQK12481.1 diterpene synthase [Anaerolineae bacterium]